MIQRRDFLVGLPGCFYFQISGRPWHYSCIKTLRQLLEFDEILRLHKQKDIEKRMLRFSKVAESISSTDPPVEEPGVLHRSDFPDAARPIYSIRVTKVFNVH